MQQSIAFFDFDGTVTSKDSLLEMIRFAKGKFSFLIGFIRLSPWIIAMKCKLLSNSEAKQKVLQFFFANTPVEEFHRICEAFAKEKIHGLVREKALVQIQEFLQKGIPVIIVSASLREYLESWCREMHLGLIATELEIREGRITGRIKGQNCHGTEKVIRIRREFDLSHFSQIYAYGDSPGDRPMLDLATDPVYKPFRD